MINIIHTYFFHHPFQKALSGFLFLDVYTLWIEKFWRKPHVFIVEKIVKMNP